MIEFERRKKNQGQFIIDFHERFALVSDIQFFVSLSSGNIVVTYLKIDKKNVF